MQYWLHGYYLQMQFFPRKRKSRLQGPYRLRHVLASAVEAGAETPGLNRNMNDVVAHNKSRADAL